MTIRGTEIPDVRLFVPTRFEDERGFFSETYNRSLFEEAGIDTEFVQDNHSLSRARGVIRGLHFQIAPKAQDKLVRVAKGSVLDVAVDIREGSETYGRHVAIELTAAGGEQLYVPKGFAHGFVTLEPDTEVLYKVSDYYSKEDERGLLWNDPALGIDWRIDEASATLNARDRDFPRLEELETYFRLD